MGHLRDTSVGFFSLLDVCFSVIVVYLLFVFLLVLGRCWQSINFDKIMKG